ncbi:MAG: transcription elongation factor GreA [Dehalococcoidia bacterium]|nr:transcription elongation factor GreA [Dehalococcoidia bacterium]MDZ4246637.1 transcription elongation factor GreA [Dehalococcoidia bacterium]
MVSNQNISLGEAADRFIITLPPEARQAHVQQLNLFLRWCGINQPVSSLTPAEMGNYAEQIAESGVDYLQKLKPVKIFLQYLKIQGITPDNLSVHLKASQISKRKLKPSTKIAPEASALTVQGFNDMKQQLEKLKMEIPRLIEEINKARADKDFKENSPLDAAREAQAHVQSRINELEETLKTATLIEENRNKKTTASIGDTVQLKNADTGELAKYKLVDSKEADPRSGKISIVSPLGKSILGKSQGQTIEVKAPIGIFHYRIDAID